MSHGRSADGTSHPDVLDWLYEEGRQRATRVPEFDVERTLSRARAALDGRDYVIPDDIQALAVPVLAHRLLPTAEAMVERHPPEQVVARIVAQTPLPKP